MTRIIAIIALILLLPVMLPVIFLIVVEDGFPILFKQQRIGKENRIFLMYKFRTMRKNTPNVATHLLEKPEFYILKTGKILRKLSLDELPNLFNIVKGDMRFVGPRPALYNQYDLIEQRTSCGIHKILPGITGWAQINGRDEISISKKVVLDTWYKENHTFILDCKIIVKTIIYAIRGKNITH